MKNNRKTQDTQSAGNESKSEQPESGPSSRNMEPVRERINRIDQQIINLLAERRKCSTQAVEAKEQGWSHLRDRQREENLLADRTCAARSCGLDSHYITKIFHEIIDDSIRIQQQHSQMRANADDRTAALIRVAFQGIEGAFSHLAARARVVTTRFAKSARQGESEPGVVMSLSALAFKPPKASACP